MTISQIDIKEKIKKIREILKIENELRISQFIIKKLPKLYYINSERLNTVNENLKDGNITYKNIKDILNEVIIMSDYKNISDYDLILFLKEEKLELDITNKTIIELRKLFGLNNTNDTIMNYICQKHVIEVIKNEDIYNIFNKLLKEKKLNEINSVNIYNMLLKNDFFYIDDDGFIGQLYNNDIYKKYKTFNI